MVSTHPRPLPASNVLAMLRAGNRRFVRNVPGVTVSRTHRDALTEGQAPHAIILSCADSRVPPESVFDVGLGELFVVRVAGNVCAPSTVGSIEYAASALGTELIVVMGHTRCGAVAATTKALSSGESAGSSSLDDIVDRITPAVSSLVGRGLGSGDLLAAATRANVLLVADRLRTESRVLAERIENGKLVVVSAEYALDTGEVSFFEVPGDLEEAAA